MKRTRPLQNILTASLLAGAMFTLAPAQTNQPVDTHTTPITQPISTTQANDTPTTPTGQPDYQGMIEDLEQAKNHYLNALAEHKFSDQPTIHLENAQEAYENALDQLANNYGNIPKKSLESLNRQDLHSVATLYTGKLIDSIPKETVESIRNDLATMGTLDKLVLSNLSAEPQNNTQGEFPGTNQLNEEVLKETEPTYQPETKQPRPSMEIDFPTYK